MKPVQGYRLYGLRFALAHLRHEVEERFDILISSPAEAIHLSRVVERRTVHNDSETSGESVGVTDIALNIARVSRVVRTLRCITPGVLCVDRYPMYVPLDSYPL